MAIGRITRAFQEKGFAFPETGRGDPSVVLHVSEVKASGIAELHLREGEWFEFKVRPNARCGGKPEAHSVRLLTEEERMAECAYLVRDTGSVPGTPDDV